jgi:hypothetical protein
MLALGDNTKKEWIERRLSADFSREGREQKVLKYLERESIRNNEYFGS